MNPLLLANWRSIATAFTVVCWLAVLVLVIAIVEAAESHAASPPHRAVMVAR
jgi:hypothetical protein